METYFVSPENHTLIRRQVEVPVPGRGEILLRVRAAAVNFRDILIKGGAYPLPTKPDLIPLSDGAGEVAAVGEGVTGVRVGDRVVTAFFPDWEQGPLTQAKVRRALGGTLDGVLSEYVVLPHSAVLRQPPELTFEQAATLPCAALTAWNALTGGEPVGAGDTVLIQGTGGVSVFALLFAKHLGATVILTSSSDEKLDRAAQLGADHLVNYRTRPDWAGEVYRITDGAGATRVVEVGGPNTLPASIAAIGEGGTIAAVGFLGGLGTVDVLPLMTKAAVLRSVLVGSHAMYAEMCAAISKGGIVPVIQSVFDLDSVDQAFSTAAQGAFGKIVIRV